MTCNHKLKGLCGCAPSLVDPPEPEEEEPEIVLGDEADQLLWALEDHDTRMEYQRALDAEEYHDNLSRYCRAAWHVIEQSTELNWNWHHELMCRVLQGLFEDWERGQDDKKFIQRVRNTILNVPPGSLKPCYIQGMITEKTRGLIPLAEVVVGDQVLTHKGRFRKVLAVAEQGELPLIEFLTGRGRLIKVAGDHPMHTQRGWIRADQVTTSDVFAAVHGEESAGTNTTTPECARLLGYIIGDGCIQGASVSFTNQDEESIADFMYCADVCGFDSGKRSRSPKQHKEGWSTHVVSIKSKKPSTCACGEQLHKNHYQCKRCFYDRYKEGSSAYEAPNKAVARWVATHDLYGKSSKTKRAPKVIMGGNEQLVAEYLAAYWSCDGAIHDRRDLPRSGRKNQTTQTVRVSATTISEGLARDHQLLLQRLGLNFRLRRKVCKLTKSMVGATGKRVGEDYVSWDLVASDQDTAAKFMQIIGPLMRHEKRTRAQGLVRTHFDQVLNPDEVVEIRDGGKGECRCLQVEEDSSFSYQGVAVHNSRIISVFYPTWCWLRRPGCKFICLSVNQDASHRDARDSRSLITSDWYQKMFQPSWKLKDDQDAISNYGNTDGGVRLSRAQGSEIVGLRGDCFQQSTRVATEHGDLSIGQIHRMVQEGKQIGVWSVNYQTNTVELQPVQASREIKDRSTVLLTSSGGSGFIRCTPDHKIWNGECYQPAGELRRTRVPTLAVGEVPVLDGVYSYTSAHNDGEVCDVYDIQVAVNHNFLVRGIQGQEYLIASNCLLIDDPNNPHEAESKTVRDEVNELWETNIFNRVNDPLRSLRIGVQQRTNAADWTGYVLSNQGQWHPEKNPDGWLLVSLPAEFESSRRCITPWGKDPRKEEGESIDKVRMPPDWLIRERKRFGSDKYAGQMQQRPALVEGGRVKRKWWNWCKLAGGVRPEFDDEVSSDGHVVDLGGNRPRPAHCNTATPRGVPRATFREGWDFDWIVISIDPAAKKTERGSNYGILVIAGQGERRFVLDDKSRRGDILEILDVLKDLVGYWKPDKVLIEEKAAGPDLMTLFREVLANGEVKDLQQRSVICVIEGIEPGAADKEMRLDAAIPTIEAGLVYLVDGAAWVEDFVEELSLFPNGPLSDRVDSLSQCLNHVKSSENTLPDW